ncbi:MAG: amino acid ABC transporter permease [Chloroflexi bacterium]|nr:amino acid ABC transporter permease [Chloroflexota bacterium]
MTNEFPAPDPVPGPVAPLRARRVVLPPARQRAARPRSVRAREWIRQNLVPSPAGVLLTLVSLSVLIAVLGVAAWFTFSYANWRVVTDNRWLLFAGGFPHDGEWRLWVAFGFVFTLVGASYGMWSSLGRRDVLFMVPAGLFAVFMLAHGDAALWSTLWFLISAALLAVAYAAFRRIPREHGPTRTLAVRALGPVLALSVPIVFLVLMAGGGADSDELSGYLLNLLLAPAGIVGGLFVGIPLAIGRASRLRTISWTCTVYIETVRGAPLIGWLFVALFILGDIIGGDLIVRTMVVLAVFTGAYMAEYIRGGLQALPRGQYEAGHAVGLPYWRTLQLIILPQALRISIPPIVGQAISLWKDTALISIILPLRELIGSSRSAIAQGEFITNRIEIYVFAALMFWIIAFIMSRVSQRIERSLGVGQR